ncbi:EAL domain-containing protein [Marinobacterium sp. AK62]|uniref:EAL domain-containing protein n=1 Tax=Marinobacterium alkalitolerans TaxID=1542925 RepID=A0ABS3Z626_9GAMM|nr:EAL domain-containing protein [Marinobacterium alkalitolerans]MBP0047153.1 EAL domain-containing protein [Marinobacterium alkalitolerans]
MQAEFAQTRSGASTPTLVLVSASRNLEACWQDWLTPWWGGQLHYFDSIKPTVSVLQHLHQPILLLDVADPEQANDALDQARHVHPSVPAVLLLQQAPDMELWGALLDDPLNDYLHLPSSNPDTIRRILRYCTLQQRHAETPKLPPKPDLSLEGYDPELWRALQREEFELFYQPRIDLRQGEICGAEALIRWQHPERGLLPPDTFIPSCETSGLIVPLGYWIIQAAGQALPAMHEAGLAGRIGINLSFRQFQDSYLASTIERLLDEHKMPSHALEFELTETALCNDEEHVRSTIEQLSQRGVEFSLDDFGTGYSSFSLLQKLPITTLKIDKSFVDGIPGNPDDEEIVRAIINLAHNLKKQVIAEGVETRAQLEFLIRHDCDQVQGYFFSRPVPLDQFLTLLSRRQRHQHTL